MRFDTPAKTNPIDRLKVVSHPVDRIDGPRKTTGTATYAYEQHAAAPDAVYGYIVGAGIAKGRITSMRLDAAKSSAGVITVLTAADVGELGKSDWNTAKLFGGPDIDHYHQAVAVVVAKTFEQARAAAALVTIDYSPARGKFVLAAETKSASKPKPTQGEDADSGIGHFDSAFASASVRYDETFATPDQSHSMMEPHASIASWEDGKLTVWTSNQMIGWTVAALSQTLKMPKEKVRVVSPFIGGGFGAKLFLRADALLAAVAAREVKRPVKIALQRPLIPNNTTHRPATIQRIRIGATREGKITAIAHESWSGNQKDGSPETAVMQTRLLYAGENRMTAMRLALLDLPEGNAMRAPGEAPGMMALEIAMDEMAERLKLDPIEFRRINDTQTDPEKPGRPFSQRELNECFRIGAEKFGWATRKATPGLTRDGKWLVGIGVAAAFRNNLTTKSGARVRLGQDGRVTVETDMTDIGTGSYTIIGQTAAEMLELPLDKVSVRLGDSLFPQSAGSGGQWGANSSTAGVYAACTKLREAIAQKLGFNTGDDIVFADGEVRSGNRSVPLTQATADGEIAAEDTIEFGDLSKTHQQSTFGAHFVEVAVDAATAEVRLRRMLAVCASGRILNPKTARSQVIGAMTMGVGAALMEELAVDERRGFFVNHDLASYEVPVHADIPHQDVIFLDETDPMSSPMKAKGVAELGICGVAAAVANAIYNATGVRVRDYPITLDKLLDRLPDVA